MRSLSVRERRLIALALAFAALVLLVFGIVLPFASGFADRADERHQLIETYARNQRVLAGVPGWRRSIEHQRAHASLFGMEADSPSQASSAVKQRFAARIRAHQGSLRLMQDGEASPGSARVWAEFRIALPNLVALLRDLQGTAPIAVIESLSINANRTIEDGQLQPLDVRLELAIAHTAAR